MAFTLLGNRYQVLQTLGSGGFGTTYLAEDLQMPSRRKCVIKQLKPIANNPQIYQLVQERFQREAATLELLGDESNQIPKLYAYFSEGDHFYLIQEWIEGMTLHEKARTQGTVPEAEVQQILTQILPVLSYVHSKRIVHRAIKLDNIILRQRDGKPVLIDFGAVRETMGTVISSQGGSVSSIVIGTPGFMPSEQAAGRPLYSSDLYSLGLTMIYLLTGKFPHELELDPATGEVVWRKYAPQASAEFASVLEKAIQYHPRDRYHTADALLTAIETKPTPPIADPSAPTEVGSVPPTIISSSPSSPAATPPSDPNRLISYQPPVSNPSATPPYPPVQAVNPTIQYQPPASNPPAVTPLINQPGSQPGSGQPADPWADQSGGGNSSPNQLGYPLPPELDRWNWGAALLPGLWSINNRVWIGLIAWSSILTCGISWIVIAVLLGAKGNQWAWRSRSWRSVEAFKANQRAWTTAGSVVWGIYAALIALFVVVGSLDSPPTATNGNGQEQSTNVFGSPEPLSEPTASIDGTWQLNWVVGGNSHEGTLTMQGNQGQLQVIVTELSDSSANDADEVQQTMRLWSSPRGLILLGYNPIDLETNTTSPTYSPDNLLFEPQSNGSYKVTVCDDNKNCADVTATPPG
ncbi:protein kinase [Phormidium tenue FACHB-886]|nr:protein kinase [Phormidium tenue FACHB-886]